MKPTLAVVGLLIAALLAILFSPRGGSANPSVAETEAQKKITAVLDRMVKSHETYLSVPVQDGKALRLLTEATDAK